MIQSLAIFFGAIVMFFGGAAVTIGIAWMAVEYWFSKWYDFKLLREFLVWRANRNRFPG